MAWHPLQILQDLVVAVPLLLLLALHLLLG
jgi:hypothetical protein